MLNIDLMQSKLFWGDNKYLCIVGLEREKNDKQLFHITYSSSFPLTTKYYWWKLY